MRHPAGVVSPNNRIIVNFFNERDYSDRSYFAKTVIRETRRVWYLDERIKEQPMDDLKHGEWEAENMPVIKWIANSMENVKDVSSSVCHFTQCDCRNTEPNSCYIH